MVKIKSRKPSVFYPGDPVYVDKRQLEKAAGMSGPLVILYKRRSKNRVFVGFALGRA